MDEYGYVLSEIVRPSAVVDSISLSSNRIVLIRNDFLQVVDIDLQSENINSIDKIQLCDKILAGSLLRNESENLLVVISGNVLSLVYNKHGKWVVEEMVSIDPKGQQQSVDFRALIVSDESSTSKYFVSHQYQGTVQLYFSNGDWKGSQAKSENSKKKKRKAVSNNPWIVKTISIGSIVVVSMAILNNDTLALLYRDFNFKYSMRYYSIDYKNQNMSLNWQFEEFDEPPSCIIPMKIGGVLVVSSLRLFYFPNDETRNVDLANFDDSLSLNTNLQVITKDISALVSIDEVLKTFEIIDQSRIMMISQSGLAYIVNFDAEINKKTININDINIIPLNIATVPANVHHISDSYFFASSRISQSVLYRVLPKDPYITIVHSMESSPPILDLDFAVHNNQPLLLSCQGGYHSGEFKKYSTMTADLSLNHTIPVQRSQKIFCPNDTTVACKNAMGLEVVVIDKESTKQINTDRSYLDVKIIENCHHIASTRGIYIDDSLIYDCKIEFAQILNNGWFIFIDHENILRVYDNDKELDSLNIKLENLTSITCISNDNIFILVTNWNGEYTLISLIDSNLTTSYEGSLSGREGILSGGMLIHDDLLFVILSSEAGITQLSLDLQTMSLIPNKTYSSKLTSLPMKIASSEELVIIYNDREIFGMMFENVSRTLVTFQVDETKQQVSDLLVKLNKLIILLNNELIQVFELKVPNQIPYDVSTVYSTDLDCKVLNLDSTIYSIVISKELAIEDSKPFMKSKLILVNTRKMKAIHTYHAPPGANLMDMCLIPNLDNSDESDGIQSFFVVLSNGTEKPLLTFQIQKTKIVLVEESKIIGLENTSDSVDFESISAYDEENSTFFISGGSNFLVTLEIVKQSPKWTIDATSTTSSSIHTIGHTIVKKEIFAADLRQGLFEILEIPTTDASTKRLTIKPIETEYNHQFPTSITSIPNNDDRVELLTGDSMGNVSVVSKEKSDFTQGTAFNIGDQVNVVKPIIHNVSSGEDCTPAAVIGTVNGGIYLLSKINIDLYHILGKCQEELNELSIRNNKDTRAWKLISKDANGKFNRLPGKDIIDLRIIHQFLLQKSSNFPLEMLTLCSSNQNLLERVYFETLLFK